jgi:hypothetical protein
MRLGFKSRFLPILPWEILLEQFTYVAWFSHWSDRSVSLHSCICLYLSPSSVVDFGNTPGDGDVMGSAQAALRGLRGGL